MTTWQTGEVNTNGIRLHYTRTGGDKSPIVLAHGITDNGLCWTRLARVLERYHDVIMVDARGHGESDKPEDGYTPDAHAEDLAGVIRELGLDRPVLMGHSMGGGTVTRVAAKYPELASAIILEDPAWTPRGGSSDSDETRAARAREWRQSIESRHAMSLAEIVASGRADNPTWALEEFEWWAPAKQQVTPAVVNLIGVPRSDWSELAARFECPALLLYGDVEKGGIISPSTAAYARQLNPLIQPRHIPGAGHNIRREQFDVTVAAIQEFLAAVRRQAISVAATVV